MFDGTVVPDVDALTVSGPEATPGPNTICAAPSELAADPPDAVTFASAGGARAPSAPVCCPVVASVPEPPDPVPPLSATIGSPPPGVETLEPPPLVPPLPEVSAAGSCDPP